MEEYDAPAAHRIGNRTYLVADVAPLDVDGVRTMMVGTALWALAFLGLLPFYGRLADAGRLWWLWTCLAGFGLGLIGVEICRRRRTGVSGDSPPRPGGVAAEAWRGDWFRCRVGVS